MENLKGKYISILGASTSTFDGFSNNPIYNSTLSINAPYYPKSDYLNNVKDTWWMKTINRMGLNLCVNNSWSGSCVSTVIDGYEKAGSMKRATELHNDNLGIEPDIIILIIGGNDALRGYEIGDYNSVEDIYSESKKEYIGNCTLFAQAHATMVHKVKNRYPNADIYVCSMLNWKPRKHNKDLTEYNRAIRKIADEFGVCCLDFYTGTGISPESEDVFLNTDGVHPNERGFEEMANLVVKVLKERYEQ